MLDRIWFWLLLLGFGTALVQTLLGQDLSAALIEASFATAKLAVELCIGLIGLLAFWLGFFKIAEQAGLIEFLARVLAPVFRRLMPEVPAGDPAIGAVTLNLAANMLGLDNAATPLGLKAMQCLQRLNPVKDTLSNPQILFLVLNASSVTLFPVSILMYRSQLGSTEPAVIFVPILLATSVSTLVGVALVAWCQRLPVIDPRFLLKAFGLLSLLGLALYQLASMPSQALQQVSSQIANWSILTLLMAILLAGKRRQVPLFQTFIDGSKEGFRVAIDLIPYLLAMLLALAWFRTSGALDVVLTAIRQLVLGLGWDDAFIPALPTALIKPFSGSGARAMLIDTMKTYGVDSFPARVAAVVQGSTETTFYVLSLYAGSVGIHRLRHALGCALLADVAGVIAAILVCYWFF